MAWRHLCGRPGCVWLGDICAARDGGGVGVGGVRRKAAASAAASAAARQLSIRSTRNLGVRGGTNGGGSWCEPDGARGGASVVGSVCGLVVVVRARRGVVSESLVEERFIAICVDRGFVARGLRGRVGGSELAGAMRGRKL